jgi:hypothetical protein
MEPTFENIKANLFPACHAAIDDWTKFPWHRDGLGVIQTHKVESSQALAIDVFGTIKVSKERDRILANLAQQCGVSDDGPWTLKLEWNDPHNLLHEPRPTQLDAIALSIEHRDNCASTCAIWSGAGLSAGIGLAPPAREWANHACSALTRRPAAQS